MGLTSAIVLVVILFFSYHLYISIQPSFQIPRTPILKEEWWGPGRIVYEFRDIVPFKINISEKVLNNLEERLKEPVKFQKPLEGVKHHYGINKDFLKTIINYWSTKYNWREREEFLNQYPQFKMKIQGLYIHFVHVKQKKTIEKKVVPILLLHGWPGSFRDFYELIPLLTEPKEDKEYVFEVVIPSLPGFGFSDAAARPGLSAVHMSVILKNLMESLGYKEYYVQGAGGLGGVLSQYIAVLYPDRISGVHSNFCFVDAPRSVLSVLFAAFYPPYFVAHDMSHNVYPLKRMWSDKLLETGEVHIQAIRPETIGVALRDSPVGLAAYILEKFTTWTKPEWKDYKDDKLNLNISLTYLLDNIMIYWVTGTISTSMRVFAEHLRKETVDLGMDRIPNRKVLSGCMAYWKDVVVSDYIFMRDQKYYYLIHVNDYEFGHFAAQEAPAKLYENLYDFVDRLEYFKKLGF